MKRIYESVAFGIVAVHELTALMKDERNDEKREIIDGTRYAYYYLIENMNKQFGVTRLNVMNALVENGYDIKLAISMLNEYESWAEHIVSLNEKGDE